MVGQTDDFCERLVTSLMYKIAKKDERGSTNGSLVMIVFEICVWGKGI